MRQIRGGDKVEKEISLYTILIMIRGRFYRTESIFNVTFIASTNVPNPSEIDCGFVVGDAVGVEKTGVAVD